LSEYGSGQSRTLKEIQDREGQFAGFRVTVSAEIHFSDAESVVSVRENFEHVLERGQTTRKTAASAGQNGDVVPQIRVDAFHRERVVTKLPIKISSTHIPALISSGYIKASVFACYAPKKRRIVAAVDCLPRKSLKSTMGLL